MVPFVALLCIFGVFLGWLFQWMYPGTLLSPPSGVITVDTLLLDDLASYSSYWMI